MYYHTYMQQYRKYLEVDLIGSKATNQKQETYSCLSQDKPWTFQSRVFCLAIWAITPLSIKFCLIKSNCPVIWERKWGIFFALKLPSFLLFGANIKHSDRVAAILPVSFFPTKKNIETFEMSSHALSGRGPSTKSRAPNQPFLVRRNFDTLWGVDKTLGLFHLT